MSENKRRGISRAKSGNALDSKKIIAAIAAIIIIIALIAGFSILKKSQDAQKASLAEQQSIEASIAESAAAEQARLEAYGHVEFVPCEIPEIQLMAEEYFKARLEADSSRLFALFGRSDTENDPELDKKLKAQADWIQSYFNIRTFVVPGLDDDSKLCIVCYDIDFRRTDTIAPGVMYFYARRNADGTYHIVDNPVKEEYEYIEGCIGSPSAQAIINESNAGLKAVLDNDSTLALIYDSFLSGEIYKESAIDVDKEQEVDLFLNPNDSILVDQSVLDTIESEAAEEEARQASLAAEDEN